jgi:hypothetical protein
VSNSDRTHIDFRSEQILEAIRTQAVATHDQALSVERSFDRLSAVIEAHNLEIRDLIRALEREQLAGGADRKARPEPTARNGTSWQSYAIIFSLFLAFMGPTLGAVAIGQRERYELEHRLGDLRSIHSADDSAMRSKVTSLEKSLDEVETQFSWLADVANLERQHALIVLDLIRQCPTCTLPPRNYWPLEAGRRSMGSYTGQGASPK